MIELRFKDFYDAKYNDKGYELYVMKNGLSDVLYVGISQVDVWNRWFGYNGHLVWDGKFVIGQSTVGQKIANHFPESQNWLIQLWLLDDCIEFCQDIVSAKNKNYNIKMLEPYMVLKLSPILNVHFNLNPGTDTTPKSQKEIDREKELDAVYKMVFEKRKKD